MEIKGRFDHFNINVTNPLIPQHFDLALFISS